MPFWRIPRRSERYAMRTLHPQGPRLLEQTKLILGMTGRHESVRKSEDGAAAVEEKVNGKICYG